MNKVYIDSEHKCHPTNQHGNYREVKTDFFVGKCDTFIGGHCYDDSNGYVRIYPWKPLPELDAAQREYEQELIADMQQALKTLGVTLDG